VNVKRVLIVGLAGLSALIIGGCSSLDVLPTASGGSYDAIALGLTSDDNAYCQAVGTQKAQEVKNSNVAKEVVAVGAGALLGAVAGRYVGYGGYYGLGRMGSQTLVNAGVGGAAGAAVGSYRNQSTSALSQEAYKACLLERKLLRDEGKL
jgi:hypothetical protein